MPRESGEIVLRPAVVRTETEKDISVIYIKGKQ